MAKIFLQCCRALLGEIGHNKILLFSIPFVMALENRNTIASNYGFYPMVKKLKFASDIQKLKFMSLKKYSKCNKLCILLLTDSNCFRSLPS